MPLDEQPDIRELSKVGEPVSAEELEAGARGTRATGHRVTAEALLQFDRPTGLRLRRAGRRRYLERGRPRALLPSAAPRASPALLSADAPHEFTVQSAIIPKDTGHRRTARSDSWLPATTADRSGVAWAAPCRRPRSGTTGAGGRIACADPRHGHSFVFLTNGLEQNVLTEGRRTTAIALARRCARPRTRSLAHESDRVAGQAELSTRVPSTVNDFLDRAEPCTATGSASSTSPTAGAVAGDAHVAGGREPGPGAGRRASTRSASPRGAGRDRVAELGPDAHFVLRRERRRAASSCRSTSG